MISNELGLRGGGGGGARDVTSGDSWYNLNSNPSPNPNTLILETLTLEP